MEGVCTLLLCGCSIVQEAAGGDVVESPGSSFGLFVRPGLLDPGDLQRMEGASQIKWPYG